MYALAADKTASQSACPMIKIEAERLPDLNVARGCHSLFLAGGEVVAAGGHTSGFVLTETAEYFADGEWHLMDMVYTADFSLCQVLPSGEVLLAGGMKENLGIGQQWTMQTYNPATHTFTGFGCLDKKRTWASGGILDSGRVVISGNWYASDAIGCFHGGWAVDSVKPVTQERVNPFIVRTASDNAIIFGWANPKGVQYDSIWADRFRGEPFRVPLLDEWRQLLAVGTDHRMLDCCVGDTATGDFTYLLPVQNRAGEVAIIKICGEDFSLLPTAQPLPVQGINGTIHYFDCVVVDRRLQCAYLAGLDVKHVLYVLRIDKPARGWNDGEAQLTLFYTDPLPEPVQCIPVLTDDGDLVFAGGAMEASDTAFHTNNFLPNKAAYILRLGSPAAPAAAVSFWWWILVAVAVLLLALLGYRIYRRYRAYRNYSISSDSSNSSDSSPAAPTTAAPTPPTTAQPPSLTGGMPEGQGGSLSSLFPRITQLMEERKLFLSSDLKLSDVAGELGTSRSAVTNSIRAACGCTFPNFVNAYRVDYVKQLMLADPEAKISTLYLEAGFANETSFFRTFKEISGMTPTEWRTANQK
jgi:AraC-like DNA-binding protein